VKLNFETERVDQGLQNLKRRLEVMKLRKAYVKAGLLGKGDSRSEGITNAQLASIHEFGLGHVPARPFLRPAFMQHKDEYLKLLAEAYKRALEKNSPEEFKRVLRLIGQRMAADIKKFVTAGPSIPPPLAEATIARKKSSRALVDTGTMIRAVDYEVAE
jgi:HK97 gp10 family phage protein